MDTILNYKEEDLVLDISEGIHDPGIFKAIILAGGPGSGKSRVAKELGLASMGLVVVNSDVFFVQLLKRKGLSLKMPENEIEDREVARAMAKVSTDKRLTTLIKARMGVIIDSTSGDQQKSQKIITMLQKTGYDVKVIFINTSLETAKKRNKNRDRTLPDKVVEFSWTGAQKVKGVLKRSAGSKEYHEVQNDEDGTIDKSLAGKLTVWAAKLNQPALQWIEAVKRGHNSVKTEDINISTMKKYREYQA
jgi:predicted kinase